MVEKYFFMEAKYTTKLNKWLQKNLFLNFVYEVKVANKQGKFYYNSGSFPKQLPLLLAASSNEYGVIYKLPDTGWGTPFDGFRMYMCRAFVIVFFKKHFYIIDVEKVEREIKKGSKSLTEDRALDISWIDDTI